MPMVFEALQARYGDCLLLTFEGEDGPLRLLVDGGPAGVFRSSLSKRLAEAAGKATLDLAAVMVSHIDEDHILGVLDLFGAIQDADKRHAPWPYRPRWLLHNSFDALAGEGEGGVARAAGKDTVLASIGDRAAIPGVDDETARSVLASYGQGSRLATLAASLQVQRNPPDRSVLMLENPVRRLVIGPATLTIVGPLEDEVEDLRQEWRSWKAKKKPTPELAAYLDRSVPNLSSIVALVEVGNRRALLTGDARGDKILEGIERAGLMKPDGTIHVDILKLPHHGSVRDVALDFFQRIIADHYVVSGDGTYGNPDRGTLELLSKARPDGGFQLHMTYDAQSCDATHKAWREARKKEFDPARDGIADLVDNLRQLPDVQVHEGAVCLRL